MKRISYNHPNYKEIYSDVKNSFNKDFNQINHDVIKKCFNDCDFEYISEPSLTIQAYHYFDCHGNEEKIKKEFKESEEEDYGTWLQENYEDEIRDAWMESEHYPMWSTLFEAKEGFLSEWIDNHVDELYGIGIGVMMGGDYFNSMLFIAGAGYNFYEAHWIPLYVDLLRWVKVGKIVK